MPFLRRRGNVASDSDMRRLSATARNSVSQTRPSSDDPSDSNPDSAAYLAADTAVRYPVIALPSPTSTSLELSTSAGEGPANLYTTDESRLRPKTPPIQDESSKHRRFSILRFRNASDSQLSLRARQQAGNVPPMPKPPELMDTVPITEALLPHKKNSRLRLPDRFCNSRHSRDDPPGDLILKETPGGLDRSALRVRPTLVTFHEPAAGSSFKAPDTTGGNEASMPSVNAFRISESSRSDASSNHTNSTTQTKLRVPPASSFSWLARRKGKAPAPLFDLSHLPQQATLPHSTQSQVGFGEPQACASQEKTSPAQNTSRPSASHGIGAVAVTSVSAADLSMKMNTTTPATVLLSPEPTTLTRSTPKLSRLQLRGRSSTVSSLGRNSMEDYLTRETTRTSSSTGRKSLGDVFGFNRLRQNAEPGQTMRHGTLSPGTPSSSTSKNNSIQIAREPISLPDRREDESAAKYLARIEQRLSRGVIASVLSRGTDPFYLTVLRSYMRRFSFFGDPMDMAIRKLLMEAELPKETQQIDRYLQAFANRYHECNPGIYSSPDQAYFVAFSLLILHTDVFNKNNKHKMQQGDYIKNTRGEGVYEPILKCFYDNITYTPFIHVEEEVDWGSDCQRTKSKTRFPRGTSDRMPRKSSKEPLDPYTLILDSKLDTLRPSLQDVMELEDHYNYLGTSKDLNVRELQRTFFRTGVLQIVSERSRPDAFRDEKSTTNPETAPQGVVDIKITKVGILWRKDAKKKKTRPRWQEWGAILTGAQLYLFRNTAWVKNLMHQYESHVKQGFYGEPVIFKPQIAEFKPDALMPTKDAVALVDLSYKKHKHAFKYARPAAFVEEILLADNEEEMNDWLAKLNYAAAFMTSSIRMRGVVGSHYEGQSRRGIRRLGSSNTAQVIQTPTGEVSIVRGRIDQHEAESILVQRHQAMARAVEQAARDIRAKEKELEEDLRNARHLQILSPVQARSRDELLREAARMDVKIKWIRMGIWRIKCHRDVLSRDLEEEGVTLDDLSPTKSLNVGREGECAASQGPPAQPGTTHDRVQNEFADSVSFEESRTDLGRAVHKHEHSWGSSLSSASQGVKPRSKSCSSTALSSTVPDIQSNGNGRSGLSHTREDSNSNLLGPNTEACHTEVDARNRDVLEQPAFIESQLPSSHVLGPGRSRAGSMSEVTEASDHWDILSPSEKQDRTRVRRSLQRTLRESAGQLSHHRSRKGKDSVYTGISEDTMRDDVLSRGSGSFVVHGKKASVIDLGDGLQHLPTEERLKQRAQRDLTISPNNVREDDTHYSPGCLPDTSRRRESATSTSTATARSFQELHRKYSSAQTSKTVSSNHPLSPSSDTESEAALSIAEGQRTPSATSENRDGRERELPLCLTTTLSPPSISSADER
ncbi:hypothetical protein SODALDRAFT_302012 [Sodiomyces alkalinus F11]|uniref:Protein transport protein sec73 n=1 Tax=Sodiomyces alkalinus (strain CBS 110278 / VKM F-3762 / F11) TaxID=1314773 RepID=A0A3N2PK55_SODAK|nr:hypothetical protein SODALDRAFT_302012 [Sodiomyces alkalinus F11]ROT34810.1 hypothetical protein SODALDRAFT_302012 [Sodiomyces alkalinus F11]